MGKFSRLSLLTGLSIMALSACGGGGSGGSTQVSTDTPPPATVSQTALRFSDIASGNGIGHSSGFAADYDAMPRHFAGGAASGDVDGDGDIDVYVARGDTGPNLLFLNDGTGRFTDNAAAAGVAVTGRTSGPTLADMDADGDLDLFIGGLDGQASFLFRNRGDGTFTDVTVGSGIDTMTSKNTISAGFADVDGDGDADMALAHWGTPRDPNAPGETETLWRNESDANRLRFVPAGISSGISAALDVGRDGVFGSGHDYSFAPNFSDIDADGDMDLLMVSDFRASQIFINAGDGTFSDATTGSAITDSNGMGAAVGDIDNDGDMDWFVSSIDGNRLYENQNAVLSDIALPAGVDQGSWGWAACLEDFDADGDLDIYHTNGWVEAAGGNPNAPYMEDRSRLFLNDGSGRFTDVSTETGIDDNEQGRAAVCADFDGDRDVDILLLVNASTQGAKLWRNDLSVANAVQIDVAGPASNPQALGARIEIVTGDLTQTREVQVGSNFTSHNPTTRKIVGLGDRSTIDRLTVTYADGVVREFRDLRSNQVIAVTYPAE